MTFDAKFRAYQIASLARTVAAALSPGYNKPQDLIDALNKARIDLDRAPPPPDPGRPPGSKNRKGKSDT
jgi:hypothetical protein